GVYKSVGIDERELRSAGMFHRKVVAFGETEVGTGADQSHFGVALLYHLRRAVARVVVDDDDLSDAGRVRLADRLEAIPQVGPCVPADDDDGDGFHEFSAEALRLTAE